jgi:hypothetical protein
MLKDARQRQQTSFAEKEINLGKRFQTNFEVPRN